MAEETQRRLAAIVIADVVGYSRLMGADEAGTLASLRGHRSELIDPLIEKHGGRIVKTTGDGMLLEFPSVVAAVECTTAIQTGMAERNADTLEDQAVRFRVGVHLGDVIVEDDDIFGDGVNVAARLEGLAEASGLALSDDAYRQVRDRLDIDWEDGGEHEVKNIARPIQVWRWSPDLMPEPTKVKTIGDSASLALPDKPSIAVLPLDNMSGDPEQEFFADGIAEDVITALSRFRSLFVIARNSTFTYKGRAVDVAQVGRELGVRYVVEGSVRKAGNRVRITAQLIDAATGNHLWADRFDGSLEDVFELQDQITEQIVIAVEPEIQTRERERARRRPPESLDAWELMQRGLDHFYRFTKDDNSRAIGLLTEAVQADPSFATAHGHLAYAHWVSGALGFIDDFNAARGAARAAAELAVSLDPTEPMGRCTMSRIYMTAGELEMALNEVKTAISANQNLAPGHFGLGLVYHYGLGQSEDAIPHFETALRLSPKDPLRWGLLTLMGAALRVSGRPEDAISVCREACKFANAGYLPYVHLTGALADTGRTEEARNSLKKLLELNPDISIEKLRQQWAGMHQRAFNSAQKGLILAGLQE